MTCVPQIGPFVVGSGLGLKTGRLAADIPKKVKKTSGDSLGFQKNDDPSHEFGFFFQKNWKWGFSDFVFRIFNRLGVLGVVFEGLWHSLGRLVLPLWAPLGLSWVSFGGSWAPLGRHLVLLGVSWRSLWICMGQSWAPCGCIWLDLAASGCF